MTTLRLLAVGAVAVTLVAIGDRVERSPGFWRLRFAVQRSAEHMPSTLAIPPRLLASGNAMLSLSLAPEDLHGSRRGLLAHPEERGRQWERFAYVTFAEGGRVRFASGVGVRVHGGKSRSASEVKSFRLYFRRTYGERGFPSALLFGGADTPLSTLIVHNDVRQDPGGRTWRLVNPLAYDIATSVGAIAPRTLPATLILNGESQGLYVLTERPGLDLLEQRFGHRDFTLATPQDERQMYNWAVAAPGLSETQAAERVDVDHLTRWFLTLLFCGTTDVFQGHMARDDRAARPRWFWLTWDLDHSFMDFYARAPEPWQIDTFAVVMRKAEVRSQLLTRLIETDPAYRARLLDGISEMLNHRVRPAFLAERLDHYESLALRHGVTDLAYQQRVREYLARRPDALRAQAAARLGAEAAVEVTLSGGTDSRWVVDGFPAAGEYRGHYFPGQAIRVTATGTGSSRWFVNGAEHGSAGRPLTLTVRAPTVIERR